jgi:hypothetical protein
VGRSHVLYCYPLKATANNWLHNCLCAILQAIHASLRAGESPPEWPAIIPVEYRARLSGRVGLRNRLMRYEETFADLTPQDQERVHRALDNQNMIPELLSCVCDCDALRDLPELIREPSKELFRFAFKLLTDLDIRDSHFAIIYRSAQYPVCPFCGCEYFDAPGAPREDLDHYLAFDYYPFAAANLRNLVPMGSRCNSSYKQARDILRKEDGSRRRSFDPYGNITIEISLDNSQPFAGANGCIPRWQIEFNQDIEEVNTWDEVFHIRERYERDILDKLFDSWLRDFSSWCRYAGVAPSSNKEVMNTLKRYSEYLNTMGIRDRVFLNAAVFRMLHKHCASGNERLIMFIKDLSTGVSNKAV